MCWLLPMQDLWLPYHLRTCCRFWMPSTKQMLSKMLDLPLPFSPVMALNCSDG